MESRVFFNLKKKIKLNQSGYKEILLFKNKKNLYSMDFSIAGIQN